MHSQGEVSALEEKETEDEGAGVVLRAMKNQPEGLKLVSKKVLRAIQDYLRDYSTTRY